MAKRPRNALNCVPKTRRKLSGHSGPTAPQHPTGNSIRNTESDLPDSSQRLFFALLPDEVVRKQLRRLQKDLSQAGGRPVPAENLHLTLLFLGDVPTEKIEAVRDTAADVAGCRFDLVLDAFGVSSNTIPCPLVGPLRTASGTRCPASITIRKSRRHRLARQQRNLSSARDSSPQSKPAKKNTGKTEPEYCMDGMPLRPDRIGTAADRLPLHSTGGKRPDLNQTPSRC